MADMLTEGIADQFPNKFSGLLMKWVCSQEYQFVRSAGIKPFVNITPFENSFSIVKPGDIRFQEKGPAEQSLFLLHQPHLFSSADLGNNENDQSNKPNHQENAPNHACLENAFYDRTTAQTKHQCQGKEKNI
jgi:hypothetical protein